ncbi:hypothetical protein PR048_023983 [Dryococelus australis]|uniref:Uncharacterized protein n=1 Tax=Dryococelus australis TaxID=614101 RepID=A0ABQ9GVN2_9NEOP|nr:hypothetical protein PR048_023983 [Dryococelus australis]
MASGVFRLFAQLHIMVHYNKLSLETLHLGYGLWHTQSAKQTRRVLNISMAEARIRARISSCDYTGAAGRVVDLESEGRGFGPRCLQRGRCSARLPHWRLPHWEFVNRSVSLELSQKKCHTVSRRTARPHPWTSCWRSVSTTKTSFSGFPAVIPDALGLPGAVCLGTFKASFLLFAIRLCSRNQASVPAAARDNVKKCEEVANRLYRALNSFNLPSLNRPGFTQKCPVLFDVGSGFGVFPFNFLVFILPPAHARLKSILIGCKELFRIGKLRTSAQTSATSSLLLFTVVTFWYSALRGSFRTLDMSGRPGFESQSGHPGFCFATVFLNQSRLMTGRSLNTGHGQVITRSHFSGQLAPSLDMTVSEAAALSSTPLTCLIFSKEIGHSTAELRCVTKYKLQIQTKLLKGPCPDLLQGAAFERGVRAFCPFYPFHAIVQFNTSLSFTSYVVGAAVAERLDCSPPTEAKKRARSPAEPLQDFRKWESCRTTPLVSGFSRGSPVSPSFIPPLHCGAAPFPHILVFIGSQDLVVKSRPNLSSHGEHPTLRNCNVIGQVRNLVWNLSRTIGRVQLPNLVRSQAAQGHDGCHTSPYTGRYGGSCTSFCGIWYRVVSPFKDTKGWSHRCNGRKSNRVVDMSRARGDGRTPPEVPPCDRYVDVVLAWKWLRILHAGEDLEGSPPNDEMTRRAATHSKFESEDVKKLREENGTHSNTELTEDSWATVVKRSKNSRIEVSQVSAGVSKTNSSAFNGMRSLLQRNKQLGSKTPIVQHASHTLHCLILAVADFPTADHFSRCPSSIAETQPLIHSTTTQLPARRPKLNTTQRAPQKDYRVGSLSVADTRPPAYLPPVILKNPLTCCRRYHITAVFHFHLLARDAKQLARETRWPWVCYPFDRCTGPCQNAVKGDDRRGASEETAMYVCIQGEAWHQTKDGASQRELVRSLLPAPLPPLLLHQNASLAMHLPPPSSPESICPKKISCPPLSIQCRNAATCKNLSSATFPCLLQHQAKSTSEIDTRHLHQEHQASTSRMMPDAYYNIYISARRALQCQLSTTSSRSTTQNLQGLSKKREPYTGVSVTMERDDSSLPYASVTPGYRRVWFRIEEDSPLHIQMCNGDEH